jgi:hypothetical protein
MPPLISGPIILVGSNLVHLLIHQTQIENCNLKYKSYKNQRSTIKGLLINGQNHEGSSCGYRTLVSWERGRTRYFHKPIVWGLNTPYSSYGQRICCWRGRRCEPACSDGVPPPIFFGPSMFHVSFFVVRCTSRSRRWLYIYRDFKGQDEYRGTNINGIGATRANVGPMAHGLPPRAVVLLSALWLAHVRSKYTMTYFFQKKLS